MSGFRQALPGQRLSKFRNTIGVVDQNILDHFGIQILDLKSSVRIPLEKFASASCISFKKLLLKPSFSLVLDGATQRPCEDQSISLYQMFN